MFLYAWLRSDRRVLTVDLFLLAFAALFASGLLVLPVFAIAAARHGDGALWFLLAFVAFFCAVGTYAFAKAGWTRQVACRRDGSALELVARGERRRLAADGASLRVRKRSGLRPPATYEIALSGTSLPGEYTLYAGLFAGRARKVAESMAAHLGVALG